MNIHSLAHLFDVDDQIVGWKQNDTPALEKTGPRYAGWLKHAEANNLLPTEFLLPRLLCPCPSDLPAIFQKAEQNKNTRGLKKTRDDLAPWGFWFKLAQGLASKPLGIQGRNRITCRSHLITSTVAKLLGKKLPETTALDIACHSGFFTMDLASRGLQQVHGIELREHNLRQAEFLKNHYQIHNASFEQADVTRWHAQTPYSVVLNLGLLYHVIDPISLIRNTYEWCTDFAVIDTVCHKEPISAYLTAFNKKIERGGEGKYTVELHPTYRALIDTLHDAGFVDLLELVAVAGEDGRVADLYRNHNRRCIVAFKRPMEEVLRQNGVLQ